MTTDYGRIEQGQEDANFAACAAVFRKSHPSENPDAFEQCDGGSWRCPECPWANTGAKGEPK